MTVTPTNIIQANEYYPFGLQTANSWTRDNTTANNFLANGGTELNTTSQVYDLEFRNYDPILGRMNQVDPMAHKYSSLTPYNYSFNSPVVMNDRSGADPFFNRDAWRGALVNNSRLPMDHDTSGSLADYARTIYDDAEGVRNGTMSLDEYAARYGSDPTVQDIATLAGQLWGSPVGNTIASMTYGGLFSFQSNGKTYGGNFVVINGAVQSLAFSFSLESRDEDYKGGLVSFGESNIVDVNGQSIQSAISTWVWNNWEGDWVTSLMNNVAGPILHVGSTVTSAVGNNIVQAWNEGVHEGGPRDPKNHPFGPWKIDKRGSFVRGKLYGADQRIPIEEVRELASSTVGVVTGAALGGLKIEINLGSTKWIDKSANYLFGQGVSSVLQYPIDSSVRTLKY